MKRLALLLALWASSAQAQFATITTTAPVGDNSNRLASTAFVQAQIAAGTTLVNSITNSDGTLTISPTVGNAVASLNLGHANTWTALQTFAATGTSLSLIGQGAATTVTAIAQPASPASGRAYALVGQIQGNGSGGQKVGIYGAAQNGVGNADNIWGGNFLAQWDVSTDISVMGVEIDLNNNQSNTFTAAKWGLNIASGGTFVGGNGLVISSTTGSNKWNAGILISTWNNAGILLGSPTSVTGDISAKQIANNTDTILLQRFTDTSPTGQFLRAVNAANSQNLFSVDVNGNVNGNTYAVNGITILQTGATYTTINDPAGLNNALLLGNTGDPTNYYNNTTQNFRTRAGISYATITTGAFQLNGATSGNTVFSESATGGHLNLVSSSTPTNNACTGFALSTGSSDITGRVTFTSATSCAINFGTAYGNAPTCTVTPGSAASTVTASATTSVLTATFGTAQTAMQYFCAGV